jgi:hypothetical protein
MSAQIVNNVIHLVVGLMMKILDMNVRLAI